MPAMGNKTKLIIIVAVLLLVGVFVPPSPKTKAIWNCLDDRLYCQKITCQTTESGKAVWLEQAKTVTPHNRNYVKISTKPT